MSGRVSYLGGIVKDNLILSVDAGKLESYNRLGPTFFDLSGRQNNGTLTNFGSTRWSSLNGGAIVFDGNNDYVEFSDVPFRITNYNFTCEFVFYYTGGSYTNQTILGKRNGSSAPFNQWAFGIYNGDPYNGGTGKVLIAFLRDDNNPNSNFNDRTLTYTLPSAGIYHVVLTNSQAQAQLWVNGVLRNTSTVALASGNFNIAGFNFRIGNSYSASYWNDKIYLARFYNKTLTNSEITQNFNAIIPRFFPNVDYNAQDFINVAGITGTTEQTAINQLVIDLKSNSLWTKMVAVYPFVGGNATTHKFNLVNPQDTNAAYRLSFVGGWTHSSSGATPNGTNAYADTFLNGSTVLTANNSHVSFYSRTDVDNSGEDFGNNSNAFGPITRQGNVMYSDFLGNGSAFSASPDRITVTNNSSNANFIFSSTASNIKVYKNSTTLGTKGSATASGYPNSNILISYGFTSGANRYSTRQLAFFTIGSGLSDAEASTLYTIIQNFNTTLGRQV